MRAGFLIVAVVLAGLALAWAIWTPPYPPSTPAPASSVRAENGRVTLAPAAAKAPAPAPPAPPPIETKPAETSDVDAEAVEAKPVDAQAADTKPVEAQPIDTKPDDTKPDDTKPDDTKPDDTKPDDTKPSEPQTTETPAPPDAPKAEPDTPAPDDSAADETDAAATNSGDDADGTDAAPSPIDSGRAADLLADWMAHEDTATDENGEPPPGVQALAAFDHEETDPDWSEATAQQIEATLRAWLEALPGDVRAHMALIHVECRDTLCQILAADSDLSSQSERAAAAQEWQQAIATLPQQPWWASFGFVDLQTSVNTDHASGYVLYQAYLRREVKPAG